MRPPERETHSLCGEELHCYNENSGERQELYLCGTPGLSQAQFRSRVWQFGVPGGKSPRRSSEDLEKDRGSLKGPTRSIPGATGSAGRDNGSRFGTWNQGTNEAVLLQYCRECILRWREQYTKVSKDEWHGCRSRLVHNFAAKPLINLIIWVTIGCIVSETGRLGDSTLPAMSSAKQKFSFLGKLIKRLEFPRKCSHLIFPHAFLFSSLCLDTRFLGICCSWSDLRVLWQGCLPSARLYILPSVGSYLL